MPGPTIARIFSSAPQTINPARCIFSSSAGDLQMTISPFRAPEYLPERTAYIFHAGRSVHYFKHTVAAVIVRQGLGLALICRQALLHHFGLVVGSLYQLSAVGIANARNLRRTFENVVRLAANAASPASRHAPQQHIRTDAKLNHERLGKSAALQNRVQLLRLRNRPRKPVEDESMRRVRPRQPF